MRPAAGWRGRRADEDARIGGREGVAAGRRPRPERAELLEPAAEMARAGGKDRLVAPGEGTVERNVELEYARSRSEPAELLGIEPAEAPPPDARAGQAQNLGCGEIQQECPVRRQVIEGRDVATRLDLAAELDEVGGQGVGDPLRTARRDRPADGMRSAEQRQPERATERLIQTE